MCQLAQEKQQQRRKITFKQQKQQMMYMSLLVALFLLSTTANARRHRRKYQTALQDTFSQTFSLLNGEDDAQGSETIIDEEPAATDNNNSSSKCSFCFMNRSYNKTTFNRNMEYCMGLQNETEEIDADSSYDSCVASQFKAYESCGCDAGDDVTTTSNTQNYSIASSNSNDNNTEKETTEVVQQTPPPAPRPTFSLSQLFGSNPGVAKCTLCYQDLPYSETIFNENKINCTRLSIFTGLMDDIGDACVGPQSEAAETCGCPPPIVNVEEPSTVPSLTPSLTNSLTTTIDYDPCPETTSPSGCSVCGEGKTVGNATALFSFPGSPDVRCGVLELTGLVGAISVNQCNVLPPLIEVCECKNCDASPSITPQPSSPPSYCPELTSDDGCSVCGEGKTVGNATALFSFPGSPDVRCGVLEQTGLAGAISVNQCNVLPALIEVCECKNCDASPSITPPPSSQASDSPTTAVEYYPCPEVPQNGCSICGEEKCVTNPEGTVSYLLGEYVSCGDLQVFGFDGSLPTSKCQEVKEEANEACACDNQIPVITPAELPSGSPSSTTPQPPPSSVILYCPELTDNNGCSVCGEGKLVGNGDAIFSSDDDSANIKCSDLELQGLVGNITLDQCGQFPNLIKDVCECRSCGSTSLSPSLSITPSITPSISIAPSTSIAPSILPSLSAFPSRSSSPSSVVIPLSSVSPTTPLQPPTVTDNKDTVFRTVICSRDPVMTGYEEAGSLLQDIEEYAGAIVHEGHPFVLCPGTNFTILGLVVLKVEFLQLDCPSRDCTFSLTNNDNDDDDDNNADHHVSLFLDQQYATDDDEEQNNKTRTIGFRGITFRGAAKSSSIVIQSVTNTDDSSTTSTINNTNHRIVFEDCHWIGNDATGTNNNASIISIFANMANEDDDSANHTTPQSNSTNATTTTDDDDMNNNATNNETPISQSNSTNNSTTDDGINNATLGNGRIIIEEAANNRKTLITNTEVLFQDCSFVNNIAQRALIYYGTGKSDQNHQYLLSLNQCTFDRNTVLNGSIIALDGNAVQIKATGTKFSQSSYLPNSLILLGGNATFVDSADGDALPICLVSSDADDDTDTGWIPSSSFDDDIFEDGSFGSGAPPPRNVTRMPDSGICEGIWIEYANECWNVSSCPPSGFPSLAPSSSIDNSFAPTDMPSKAASDNNNKGGDKVKPEEEESSGNTVGIVAGAVGGVVLVVLVVLCYIWYMKKKERRPSYHEVESEKKDNAEDYYNSDISRNITDRDDDDDDGEVLLADTVSVKRMNDDAVAIDVINVKRESAGIMILFGFAIWYWKQTYASIKNTFRSSPDQKPALLSDPKDETLLADPNDASFVDGFVGYTETSSNRSNSSIGSPSLEVIEEQPNDSDSSPPSYSSTGENSNKSEGRDHGGSRASVAEANTDADMSYDTNNNSHSYGSEEDGFSYGDATSSSSHTHFSVDTSSKSNNNDGSEVDGFHDGDATESNNGHSQNDYDDDDDYNTASSRVTGVDLSNSERSYAADSRSFTTEDGDFMDGDHNDDLQDDADNGEGYNTASS